MKVILKENIENLGKRGDIIDVAAGYGRNYLIPRKLALEVTPTNMKTIEIDQRALRKKLEKEVVSCQSLMERLNQTSLSFERKAGDKDVIFGSVSIADIKEGLDSLGFDIEKKRILLDEPIKRLGNYTVSIKVFHDEQAEIKIEVKKEGETEAEEKKQAVAEKKEETAPEAKKEEVEAEEEEPVLEEERRKMEEEKKEEQAEPIPEEKQEEAIEKQAEEPEK
ncbi:MAG: 50S ribosomal protein L9 [Candidatus Aminicenantes bacterium]|nr:50S ribosomal protein L9 [Candidatus Aminicenantes bacterium]MDH5385365.1 50S ribosomal protein L9 [Candidatus Aminicenantes bacterium]MDH5742047.1 50S ribosomal protein L9 [Candidatus Aminicenantes bacterium]